jgi:hypothetical protein
MAREQARTVVCASNQRQILANIYIYVQDNKGWLPLPLEDDLIGREFYATNSHCATLVIEEELPFGGTGGVSAIGPPDASGHSMYMVLTIRHGGNANEGFADQHVERVDPRVFDDPLATGGHGAVYTDTFAHYIDSLADR